MGNSVQETDIITDSLWDVLEESLLGADVGPSTAHWLIERLHQRASEERMQTGAQVQQALREELAALLGKTSPLRFAKQSPLTVFLIIGVNGSGKTTSIAKLAYRLTPGRSQSAPGSRRHVPSRAMSSSGMGKSVLIYLSFSQILALIRERWSTMLCKQHRTVAVMW